MGGMSILVMNGLYKYGTTTRLNQTTRCHFMGTYFTHPMKGLAIMDEQSTRTKVIIHGQEVLGSIRVNVINKNTCDQLGIRKWEACPFWLRMANTSIVWPIELIWQLDIVIGKHTFQILGVVLHLDAPGAYPLLFGRPWLWTANIEQIW